MFKLSYITYIFMYIKEKNYLTSSYNSSKEYLNEDDM